ncbi:glycerate kinase type-2 family protein [Verminephrobacter aporrectodeae]|uniref:glycerate kinase type-2 family protein n=2 Tax=Verminephrobacter aporrectodeae TaxID=1110389 RepID=UPI0022388A46|nr:glycerate kinase [Verminephrobacter aporrectodeae]MCW5219683.1 glycerate kinase [Verminephrobacter aporrectodeae subsp. tuberculatae]MCW5287619.1 glycerate kinase [Verminephrobacter aporrectodeae subsp. tuberculatae]MCW8164647.1 glycerate kinase [Verminephrobacter aporrectodeae subsp. tuberculatae]MCW8170440.1 glycerate kinase [Verminephrobacter aporrectodeae subsp. tuberculatae]MCW8176190.1 glycerate kinase [Verminephrobacter aporrectodeae subsp. tuberculatae]
MHTPPSTPAAAPACIPDFRSRPRDFLRALFDAAVRSAQPLEGMRAWLPAPPKGRTLVLGAGKAGGAMAQALEALWPGDAPLSGLVLTRYGHIPPRPAGLAQRIEVVEAAHPVPDAAGLAAAQRILALTRGLSADDLVLCLISGGGSALLTLPCDGLTLHDKQRINRALLDSGAQISEMNCVRKHLSRIKGGRLALACAPARVLTLAISDVPGDDPGVIASGPTVPDASHCAHALAILARYGIDVPAAARAALEAGTLETPKPGDARFAGHCLQLIATPWQALEAAAATARAAGLAVHVLSDEIEGEACEVGRVHAALARSVARRGQPFAAPCVILSGGETTVTVRARAPGLPRGRGGRAGEFCLGLAQALQGAPAVWALAADTDGIDGSQDNAGALVCPDTLARARSAGLHIDAHLAGNDSWGFFAQLDDLLVTGPTHTNVNDFRALLIV